jgi:hypothetical protein
MLLQERSTFNGSTWLGTKDSWLERRCLIGQVLSTQIMTDSSKCHWWDFILGRTKKLGFKNICNEEYELYQPKETYEYIFTKYK